MPEWIVVRVRPWPHHRKDATMEPTTLARLPTTLRVFHVPARPIDWKACRARLLWQVHPDDVRAVMRVNGEKYQPGQVFYVCGHRVVAPTPVGGTGGESMTFLYQQSTWNKLDAFSFLMEQALQRNSHKGGWADEPDNSLLRRLQQEVNELAEAVRDRRTTIGDEAAGVANVCLMIADNWGYLKEVEPEERA